jgi:ribonuclease III
MCCEDMVQNRRRLETALAYTFKNETLLISALTHKSFANERPGKIEDNQRLEFLGDAILGAVSAQVLMERLPDAPEGILTQRRAALVNESSLAELARGIDLGSALLLGRGEEMSNGRDRSSTLCDAVESVLGAVFLDGGFDEAARVIRALTADKLDEVVEGSDLGDAKGILQERLQASNRSSPCYRLMGEDGPDHAKVFEVEILVDGCSIATGRGRSKKEAEKDAALRALKEVQS